MSVLLLILGLLLGGACVFAFVRVNPNRERMRDELKAISLDVLAQTGDSLAQRLADQRRAEEERAAGEMARRAEEIKGLVGRSRRSSAGWRARSGAWSASAGRPRASSRRWSRQLGDGVGTLRQETGNLVSALKRPTTRGAWGEIQLRNVVEMAGMVSHCDFVEQSTIQTGEGTLRPDMLVRLPGGKLMVVDSKVPLDAYLSALEAAERGAARAARSRATRARRASTSPSWPPRATSASSTPRRSSS